MPLNRSQLKQLREQISAMVPATEPPPPPRPPEWLATFFATLCNRFLAMAGWAPNCGAATDYGKMESLLLSARHIWHAQIRRDPTPEEWRVWLKHAAETAAIPDDEESKRLAKLCLKYHFKQWTERQVNPCAI